MKNEKNEEEIKNEDDIDIVGAEEAVNEND